MHEHSQFTLLASRRFLPIFLTQFLGAFNDNLFKNALLILVVFSASAEAGNFLVNLSAGLFILPFFLLSALAGQVAEKYEKAKLIQRIKLGEIAIMAVGAVALLADNLPLLIAVLFLMGAQSTFFGPVKYSILPQQLRDDELVGGNGLVEMGTFLAILLGTIAGGVLIAQDDGWTIVAAAIVVCAIAGWLTSRPIPTSPAAAPDLKIGWNPIAETMRMIRIAGRRAAVFKSILGISWFWMLGAAYLTQLPNFTRLTLGGEAEVVTLLLAVFSVGIGVGSLLCERLSGHKVELGLVPFGSIGLSLFGFDLYIAANTPWPDDTLRGLLPFVQDPGNWRVLFDLAMIGVFGGFYIVPLYAIIQNRTEPEFRGRVIAANNIMNALFMVASALLAILLLNVAGLSIPAFFLVMAFLNVGVAVYIYSLVPEFFMRFLVWLLTSTLYRIRRSDLDKIPEEGAALLVCNHVSYVDALIIAGSCRRPVRFVMDARIYNLPVLRFICRTAGAIPILSQRQDPETYERAFKRIDAYLKAGEIVCIFPEGMLTLNGDINVFRPGVMRILNENPVPVVPLALRGLWGSFFSRADLRRKFRWLRAFKLRIELVAGDVIAPDQAAPELLQTRVSALRGNWA